MSTPGDASALAEVLQRRRSIRGFLPEPLPRERLLALFGAAQHAPSWCNIQPWRVVVTEPPLTAALSKKLVEAASTVAPAPDIPFPVDYPTPYGEHRKACGVALYGAMDIARGDSEKRRAAWLRNYEIFDAPHLAVVSHDRRLGQYATLDVGVWLGVLLTVAEAMGIDTCPMASTAAYPAPLREALVIPDEEMILFGIAIGVADKDVPANACRTTRDPLARNVRFVGATDS